MKSRFQKIIVISCLLIMALFYGFFGYEKGNFYGDSLGYYLYLPTTFIHHNFKEPEHLPPGTVISPARKMARDYLGQIIVSPKGYLMNQYTYGVALMELPFFLVAHTYEMLIGGDPDGFSGAYDFMIDVSTFFYALLGLYILFLCLKRFFPGTPSILGLCIIVLGSNFLWFTAVQGGMAHIPIFFLVSSLLYLTILVHETPRWRYFLLGGLCVGMIGLIRPTDIILISIPALYGIYSPRTFIDKFRFIFRHKWKILATIAVTALLALPQMLYWKEMTGKYIFYSYGGNQKFHWRHPHIKEGLLSYKNGWIIYSPVMALFVLGLLYVRRIKHVLLIILLTVPVYVYLIYAWYCFNYINGLGSRPMIHIYPLLAFPIVALLYFIGRQGKVLIALSSVVFILLSFVSVSYCIQEGKKNLWSENSTKTFNLHTMFRYKLSYNDIVLFDNEIIQPDAGKLTKTYTLDSENFEHFNSKNVELDPSKGSNIYFLHNGDEYPECLLQAHYDPDTFAGAKWIKCSGAFNAPVYGPMYSNHLIVLEVYCDTGICQWKSCIINNKIGLADTPAPPKGYNLFDIRTNTWGTVHFFAPIPKGLKKGNKIRMIIWALGRRDLYMDDLKLELYQ